MGIKSAPMNAQARIYDVVMDRLRAKDVSRRRVAHGSGVPFSTVVKIAQRQTRAPSVHHIQALYDYFTKVSHGDTPAKEWDAA